MRALAPPGECPYCDASRDPWALIIAPAIASRSSITLAELLGDFSTSLTAVPMLSAPERV